MKFFYPSFVLKIRAQMNAQSNYEVFTLDKIPCTGHVMIFGIQRDRGKSCLAIRILEAFPLAEVTVLANYETDAMMYRKMSHEPRVFGPLTCYKQQFTSKEALALLDNELAVRKTQQDYFRCQEGAAKQELGICLSHINCLVSLVCTYLESAPIIIVIEEFREASRLLACHDVKSLGVLCIHVCRESEIPFVSDVLFVQPLCPSDLDCLRGYVASLKLPFDYVLKIFHEHVSFNALPGTFLVLKRGASQCSFCSFCSFLPRLPSVKGKDFKVEI
jgi:hypothetical protein